MYKIKNATAIVISILAVWAIFPSCKSSGSTATPGDWQNRSELDGVARTEAVSFVIGDSAYLATGYDGTYRLADVWQYNPALDSWRQKADLPGTPRSSAVAFALNGKGYVGTGYDGANNLNDFWQYDPTANSWTRKADFGGSARYDAVGFAVLNKGYISTGYDGNYLKDFWQYDDASNSWTQMISFGGTKRSQAVAFVYNNKAFIVTGNNNGVISSVNDFWVFDPTANPYWSQRRDITNANATETYDDGYTNIARTNAVAFVIGDYAYLSTGTINGAITSVTWQYNIAQDLWVSGYTPFENSGRQGAVGFSVSNKGYVATGNSGTAFYDDMMQFYPDSTYVAGN